MSAWDDDREAALDTIRVWRRHWHTTTGIEHEDARTELQAAVAYYRRFHKAPANARYAAAVARSKQQRTAA